MRRARRGKAPPFKVPLLLWLTIGGGKDPAAYARAQDLAIPAVSYPGLPKWAASADGFVPAGWLLEAQASGDLNQDGMDDLALVIRQKSPDNVIPNSEGLGEAPFDTNPRILAVAFREKSGTGYALQLEDRALIPRRTNPVAEDPFDKDDGIAIRRGSMQVRLRWFLSAGGWETFTAAYTFRHRHGRFELIGYDRDELHRGSGATNAVSINYLTGKVKVTTGNMQDDATKVRQRNLPRRRVLLISDIGDGLEFDPDG
jgi:hypothetical protein